MTSPVQAGPPHAGTVGYSCPGPGPRRAATRGDCWVQLSRARAPQGRHTRGLLGTVVPGPGPAGPPHTGTVGYSCPGPGPRRAATRGDCWVQLSRARAPQGRHTRGLLGTVVPGPGPAGGPHRACILTKYFRNL
jgi:hypothetical protein